MSFWLQNLYWIQVVFGLVVFGFFVPWTTGGSAVLASASTTTFLLPRDAPQRVPGECGTPFSLEDQVHIQEAIAAERATATARAQRRQSDSDIVIDVHFNVLMANLTYEGGMVPETQLEAQVRAMNQGFSGSGIQFRLLSSSYILRPVWFHEFNVPETEEISQMLYVFGATFRQGGASTLNINLVGFTHDEDTYGFALPPTYYERYPKYDGVFAKSTSLPGGSSPYRQGSTVIHETGHWLGLWHTFQNGCIDGGDGIDDTPPANESSSGCPIGKDTCPQAGEDPIHNFMDYSAEGCRREFSLGQIERMHDVLQLYRL